MAERYVKFFRGTPKAFKKLRHKNSDTLYFITEPDDINGLLYLGNKLIADSTYTGSGPMLLAELKDVLVSENLSNEDILIYNSENQLWENKKIDDLFFVGATENSAGKGGFVPAPLKGEINLFLRSDGRWEPLDIYSRKEIDEKIASAAHLKRKIVNSIKDIEDYLLNNSDADQYIFMVPSGTSVKEANKYDEFIIVNDIIERVGSWDVDLSQYAKLSDITIKSVNEEDFELKDSVLFLKSLSSSKIVDLQDLLNEKVDKREGYDLISEEDQQKIDNLTFDEFNQLVISTSNIVNLEELLNKKADKTDVEELANKVKALEEQTSWENF